MMKFKIPNVYKIIPAEDVELVSYVQGIDVDRTIFDGRSLQSTWEPIRVERITEDEGQKWIPGDLPGHNVGDLVLNRRAKDKIGAFLEQYGELLPLVCDDGEFWTLNVTCIIDALDEHQSVALKSSEPGRLLMISKYVFRPEALENAILFKIPQNRRGMPLVTTPFVELIKSYGLTGSVFKQIWAPN